MRRLVPFAEVEGMATDWEVHVIKDDGMMNAFVLPGYVVLSGFREIGFLLICE